MPIHSEDWLEAPPTATVLTFDHVAQPDTAIALPDPDETNAKRVFDIPGRMESATFTVCVAEAAVACWTKTGGSSSGPEDCHGFQV